MPDRHELDPLPEEIPEPAEPTPEHPRGWRIDNDILADWALRRIAQEHARQDEDTRTALAEIARWQTWAAEQHQTRQRRIERLTAHLEAYYHQLQDAGKLGKTYKLPFGKLKMTTRPPKWAHNDDILLDWAKEKDLIRVKEEVDWAAVKDRLQTYNDHIPGSSGIDETTGELIPGVTLETPRRQSFSIELNKEASA